MWFYLWLAASLFVPVAAVPSDQSPAVQPAPSSSETRPASSKIWKGRDAEFEEFLRSATIARTSSVPVGITAPRHGYFEPGGLAAGAAIKKLPPGRVGGFFESYKSEIAAYKLDRLLQLDMVPPTVERRIDGEMASVQLWVEHTRMLKDVRAAHERDPDGGRWNRQLHRVQVFDDLVGNIDENAGNLLFDPQWNFIKIDHSRAFTGTGTLPFDVEKTIKQIDRPFFERIKALDRESVKRAIGDLLIENGALEALVLRRDRIVSGFERLAQKTGQANVFVAWPEP
jgi:hypothetical protein